MYQPKYTLSDKLLINLIDFELAKKTIEDFDYDSSTKKTMANKAKAINLFHLAHLIGVELTIKDAQKAVDGKKIITNDPRGTLLNNFRNSMEFIRSTVTENYVDLDINLILHINKLLLTDWKEQWEAKIRTDVDPIDTTLDTWTKIVNKELNLAQREDALNDLIHWYKSSVNKIHPLIRTAIIIFELSRIAPLAICNQITIISLTDFLLQKHNYLERAFIPIVREFDLHNSENVGIWEMTMGNNDLTAWIERFVLNLSKGTCEDRDRIINDAQMQKTATKQPFLDLNRRQLKILRYLQTIPTVKREDYVQMMDISTMTAFRDLIDLVKKKLIKVEGQGRGTKYFLSSRYL
jgi:Fic family protein